MKWSALASVCLAPLALAGMLNTELLHREAQDVNEALEARSKDHKTSKVNADLIHVESTEIIIIWVNNGGGAATSTLNAAMSTSASAAAAAATHQVRYRTKQSSVFRLTFVRSRSEELVDWFIRQIRSKPRLATWSSSPSCHKTTL